MKMWKIVRAFGFLSMAASIGLLILRAVWLRGFVQEGCVTNCAIGLSEATVAALVGLPFVLGMLCLAMSREKVRVR